MNEPMSIEKVQEVARHAVQTGQIVKKPCEECGDVDSEMHHPDYRKPFEVTWLCRSHHRQIHGTHCTRVSSPPNPKLFITAWRKEKRMSLRELARRIGISHVMLLKIERGVDRITYRTSKKLAPVLKTSWKNLCDE